LTSMRKIYAKNPSASRYMDILEANYLVLLGRYEQATQQLSPENEPPDIEPHSQSMYFRLKAILHALQGHTKKAFAGFDCSAKAASRLPDGSVASSGWDDYANYALELGRLDIARFCRERALFVARERRIAWRIPYTTLRLASLLIVIGDYNNAQHFHADAMSFDTETPILRVLKATVAIELGQMIEDTNLLKRVLDDAVLELAFRSDESPRICAIVTAYAKAAIVRHQTQRARSLVSRGIGVVRHADQAGELLALAARYGTNADAVRAKTLLESRLRLPHHRVAQAYLWLWEVHRALGQRSSTIAKNYAQKAAQSFASLGWKHQEAETLALVGAPRLPVRLQVSGDRLPVLRDLKPALTKREQQVAELVLRGLTNRVISQMLSISEHTVESHMTSILNRLGLRSRWQLVNLAK